MSAPKKPVHHDTDEVSQDPLLWRFSWVDPESKGDQNAQFAALTLTICQGLDVCLELVHNRGAELESGAVPPILSFDDSQRLLRLAMVNLQLLGGAAVENLDHTETPAKNGGGKA